MGCVFVRQGQLDFNQLAIEWVQNHICNHVNNCSSLESDTFQPSFVVSLTFACCLNNFCIERVLHVDGIYEFKQWITALSSHAVYEDTKTVRIWVVAAVKKLKNDLAVSKLPLIIKEVINQLMNE